MRESCREETVLTEDPRQKGGQYKNIVNKKKLEP